MKKSEYSKLYYEANKEKIRKQQKEYYLKNKSDESTWNESQKKYHAARKELTKAKAKIKRSENKEAIRERNRSYYLKKIAKKQAITSISERDA